MDTNAKHPKIAGVAILYNPEEALLLKSLNSWVPYVDKAFVFLNSAISPRIQSFLDENNIHAVNTDGENRGISYALNQMITICDNEHFDYLLTMDQDTLWRNFSDYKSFVLSHPDREQAIYGPEIGGESRSLPVCEETDHVITSGTLVPIKLLKSIGGYLPQFTIDGIDVEVCYRARERGYKVYRIYGTNIDQKFGEEHTRKFCGKSVQVYNYPPIRLRGIIRNHLHIMKMYKLPKWFRQFIIRRCIFKNVFNVMLWEDRKISKLHSIIRGLSEGLLLPPPQKPPRNRF